MDNNLIVDGFQFAAVKAGIRGKDRLDLGLIYCDTPAVAVAVFTKNLVAAAPVILGRERFVDGQIQAVMINSGVANACTGNEGMKNARFTAKMLANIMTIPEELVVVSSTGVIGEQLDINCFHKGVKELASGKSRNALLDVAKAIMTTDTVPKSATRKVVSGGHEITIVGISKGAGMIMPNMATMLGFIMTDAKVEAPILQKMLRKSVELSFNRISVDGDTSTNDTVMLLASGKVEGRVIDTIDSDEASSLQFALTDICLDLAKQIVADGEGASKLVTVKVSGTKTVNDADKIARTVANSALVKTAFFGEDANWGRIMAAMGRSGVDFDPYKVDIYFDEIKMVEDGLGRGTIFEKQATVVLKKEGFTVEINLKDGDSSSEIYTCDFSLDYVKINADYRT